MTNEYVVTIRDWDGLTIGGTTKYVASAGALGLGYAVDLQVTKLSYDFQQNINSTAAPNKPLQNLVVENSPSGTGAANSLTDTTKNWVVDCWKDYQLVDAANATFTISSNTATVLTVSGTPSTGAYEIRSTIARLRDRKESLVYTGLNNFVIRVDCFVDFVTALADASITAETGTGTGASNSFTVSGASWYANEWVGSTLVDSASTSFTVTANTATVLTVSGTPASGAYTLKLKVKGMTMQRLLDFIITPVTFYLRDYIGTTTTEPTFINTLINQTDIFGYPYLGNTKIARRGLPVRIVRLSNFTFDQKVDKEGRQMNFTMELREDQI